MMGPPSRPHLMARCSFSHRLRRTKSSLLTTPWLLGTLHTDGNA